MPGQESGMGRTSGEHNPRGTRPSASWPSGWQFFLRRKAGPSCSSASSASAIEPTTQHAFRNQKRTRRFLPWSYPRWPLTLQEC
ncbi:hypothetical protein LEMLEM_LOCUS21239, partial [Lemmus lemmus]